MDRFDLHVTPGERFDRVLVAKAGDAAMSLADWDPVMLIAADGTAIYTSLGETPDISLTKEPSGATGEILVELDQELTASLLAPYGNPNAYSYRIDLVDSSEALNEVPVLWGYLILERRFAVA